MELNRCGKEGCNPVEQVRGQMKPEDHHLQFQRHVDLVEMHKQGIAVKGLDEFRRDAHNVENSTDEHASDFRISCSKCGKATGWDRASIEEFRRHADGDHRRHVVIHDGNKDNVRARWNEMVCRSDVSVIRQPGI